MLAYSMLIRVNHLILITYVTVYMLYVLILLKITFQIQESASSFTLLHRFALGLHIRPTF